VVGRGHRAQSISRRVDRLRLRVRIVSEVAEAVEKVSEATAAVVLVEPLPEEVPAVEAIEDLRGRGGSWAVFVVVAEDYPDRRARRLYEAGATAVFAWPREALVLPAMLRDLLRVPAKGGRSSGDAALSRAVRARLQLDDDASVTARISGGIVTLAGQMSSYWRKTRLVDMLGQIPGVLSVHCDAVEIVPVKRPDEELATDVRNVLLSVAGVDARTIAVEVHDGMVTLTGTVSRHGELGRLTNVVGNIEGVRGIDSHVSISSTTSTARGLSSRLRKKIEAMFPTTRAIVTVFGTIAVLDGHVPTLSEKRSIEDLARDTPGIERVVNKLTVSP